MTQRTQASHRLQLMGTTIDLMVEGPQAEAVVQQGVKRLIDFEHRFSANRPDSQLSQLNQASGRQAVQVDQDLFDLIEIGRRHSLESAGRLNIAIGPLVQLWRIGFKDARRPSQAEIDQALKLVNPQAIQLQAAERLVYLSQVGMKLDLGALAKGYFADLIMDDFKAAGATTAMINLGGNLLIHGPNPAKRANPAWQVGIQDPDKSRGHNRLVIQAMDQSVVTSGIYERQLEVAGQTYHHIFDSRTGYPIHSDIVSVTIISDRSLDGEIWTTRLFGLDVTTAMEAVSQRPGIAAIIMIADRRVFASPKIKGHILQIQA